MLVMDASIYHTYNGKLFIMLFECVAFFSPKFNSLIMSRRHRRHRIASSGRHVAPPWTRRMA